MDLNSVCEWTWIVFGFDSHIKVSGCYPPTPLRQGCGRCYPSFRFSIKSLNQFPSSREYRKNRRWSGAIPSKICFKSFLCVSIKSLSLALLFQLTMGQFSLKTAMLRFYISPPVSLYSVIVYSIILTKLPSWHSLYIKSCFYVHSTFIMVTNVIGRSWVHVFVGVFQWAAIKIYVLFSNTPVNFQKPRVNFCYIVSGTF